MEAKNLLRQVYERLTDEHDEDPRSPMMRALSALIEDPKSIPATDSVELSVTIRPGGAFTITDQAGRPLAGAKAVSVYKSQSGEDILQIIM